jgi:uncharacterized paraquat-inducible protein A
MDKLPIRPKLIVTEEKNVVLNCPNCQQELDIPAEFFGQTVECPTCSRLLSLPQTIRRKKKGRLTFFGVLLIIIGSSYLLAVWAIAFNSGFGRHSDDMIFFCVLGSPALALIVVGLLYRRCRVPEVISSTIGYFPQDDRRETCLGCPTLR